jgi:hypothetical protein
MLNPFFLNGSKTEQNLVQDIINEQLRMYGIEVYYLPRIYATTNTVIKEVIESEFKNAYPIEAYVDNYEGYTGQGSLLSKFGIENRDDLQLIISKDRFENYISPLIKGLSIINLSTRPKEGDLIYFPLGDRLFEIKFVEHEQPFYQLRETYVYELRCELFRYEDEVLDTGIAYIDDEIQEIGYIQTLSLIGSGSTATATASICSSGSINRIYLSNMGRNYESVPTVGFSSAPIGGTTAVGIASISFEYPNCTGKSGRIPAILLTNTGCGYTVSPWITVQGGNGSGFAATTGISTNGSVQSFSIVDGGSGYTSAPNVSIGKTLGYLNNSVLTFDSTDYTWDYDYTIPIENAVAISTISSAGIVTGIYIISGGDGFKETPTIIIDPPKSLSESGIGTGSFIFNEIISGQTSGVTARVKEWNAITNILEISIISGSLIQGETVVGSTSGAKFIIGSLNDDDIVTPYADNDNIEIEADQIIDFSTSNPFGMP